MRVIISFLRACIRATRIPQFCRWLYRHWRRFFCQQYLHWQGVVWTGEVPEIRGRLPILRVLGRVHFGSGCVLQSVQVPIYIDVRAGAVLELGERVQMNCGVRIMVTDRIEIGDDVLIGAGATIYDSHFHQVEPLDPVKSKGVRIENGAWLGRNAIVLRGVTVGANSALGAGCVASRDVPPNSIMVAEAPVQVRQFAPGDDWVRR